LLSFHVPRVAHIERTNVERNHTETASGKYHIRVVVATPQYVQDGLCHRSDCFAEYR
jgi:hypothetical protein